MIVVAGIAIAWGAAAQSSVVRGNAIDLEGSVVHIYIGFGEPKVCRRKSGNVSGSHYFLATLGSFILATSCGGVSDSPAEVVEDAYMAANERKYSEAGEYLASEVHTAAEGDLRAPSAGVRGMPGRMMRDGGMCDRMTHDGKIERIEIREEKIRGEGVHVRFRIYFKDGRTKEI